MADVTPDPIMRIAMGFMASKHLFVASATGLFEALASGPATLGELAAKCGVPRRTLGISVDAMVSLDLVKRDGDRYRNSPAAAAFLAGAAGPDLRPMLRFWDHISYGLWANLEGAVRAGEGKRQFHHFHRRAAADFLGRRRGVFSGCGGGARGKLRFQQASPGA